MTLIAGAIAFPAATLPAMPVAAVSPIRVVTSSQWTETLGAAQVVHMVGQIQNQSGGNVASVQLNIDWLDSNKVVVGHSSTVATRKVLANLDYSPFEDIEFPAAVLARATCLLAEVLMVPLIRAFLATPGPAIGSAQHRLAWRRAGMWRQCPGSAASSSNRW